MHIGTSAGALLSTVAMALAVRAAPGSLGISVACDELSAEERAHVEAMVRADLMARAAHVLEIKLECQPSWITAELTLGDRRLLSDGEPKASARAHIAEQLIALSDRVLSLDSANGSVATDATSMSPALGKSDATTTVPIARAIEPQPVPEPSTTPSTPTILMHRSALVLGQFRLSGSVRTRHNTAVHTEYEPVRFEGAVGADLELAPQEHRGLLGPRIKLGAIFRERFAVNLQASIVWALDAPEDFALRDHRVGVGAEWMGSRNLSLGVSALLTAIHVSAPSGVVQRSSWSELEPAARAHIGARWSWGDFTLAIEPHVTLYAHPRAVRLDSSNVTRLPVFLLGVGAQTAYRF